MKNIKILIIIYLCSITGILSAQSKSGHEIKIGKSNEYTITPKGAWCWFADPRAIHYENEELGINHTYVGYIDTHGAIKATQYNHSSGTTNEVLVRSWFQPDDHNNPTFLALPDGRIMIFYSRHTDEPCFYYRVSAKPGDITTLGREIRLATANNTTYPSPFILSDDPEHIYLCWRGINWHPTIARLTLPDSNDNVTFNIEPKQIVQSTAARPYAKYASNGKDKIYLAYTTGHPDNEVVNYIYFNYIDINDFKLKDIKGKTLAAISDELHQVSATEAYFNTNPDAVADNSPYRNWLWEVSMDANDNPVIATVRISEDKESHDYYYARWTGTEWIKIFLENAGGHFHQTPNLEKCYSGGMAIDGANSNIIYASVPVAGKNGTVYELKKYTIDNNSNTFSTEQLTSDSEKNNIRPYAIKNTRDESMLISMYGDYYDWIVSSSRPLGYPTEIRANFTIPQKNIDLEKGLIRHEKDNATISIPDTKTFTIILSLNISHENYYGEILKAGNFIYGLHKEENPKPYIKTETSTYTSTNVLGSSDIWKTQKRGTGGHWYEPEKLNCFQLAISYENGELRTFINGLADQYIEIKNLSLSNITSGSFNGTINDIRVYDRALSQDEIKAANKIN